jgi:hypothetical protein
MDRSLSPPTVPQPIILGIFGSHSKICEDKLIENILMPILQELGRLPDKVLVPSEGNTSIYIQSWTESLHIPYHVFESDWKNRGRSATILRDARIQKECTYAIVFLSQRSTRYELLAEKMARQNKTVFTISYQDLELTLLELQPSLEQPEPIKRGRRSSNGKVQSSLPKQERSILESLLSP